MACGDDGSDFPDEWEDRKAADRYLIHVRELYTINRIYREKAFQSHTDYAKWILASLLAVHGGVIYGLSNIRTWVPAEQRHLLVGAAGWSLMGIACTLLVGFFIWLNFQFLERYYERESNPSMLYSQRSWPMEDERFDPINATYVLAISFGILSWLCFCISTSTVIGILGYGR